MANEKKKFLFDRQFDEEEPLDEVELITQSEAELEEEALLEEAAPTFSEEDLADAREESFNQGRDSGTKEALEGIETRIAQSLGTIEEKLSDLYQIQRDTNRQNERDSVILLNEMVKKLFPYLNKSSGYDHISQMAEEVLANLGEESRVTVLVNDELADSLKERLESFLLDRGFEGILTVQGEPQVDFGDCRIEWPSGSAERNMAEVIRSIDQIIERSGNSTAMPEEAGTSLPAGQPIEAPEAPEAPEASEAPETPEENAASPDPEPTTEMMPEAQPEIQGEAPMESPGDFPGESLGDSLPEELDTAMAGAGTGAENSDDQDMPDADAQP